MLKIVSSRPELPTEQISQHIDDYAPAIALCALGTISGEVSYESMKKTVTEHLHDWWKLSVPSGTPKDGYESTYWYLVHLLESLEEHELLGNNFMQFKVSCAAQYLLGLTERQDKMQGIRP
ncbi:MULTISPECIES: hypothetical protein [Photobacterium]|uniref:Uncharacterized protein n=1 Tax=Photobacterium ganghwense TaxID=320778 RepID=A0A0J1HHH9_9GAMM|nr:MULTISPECIES: hypothetical protein [Photobacterium]KLV11081.1 hypothetical protein ABT57_04105 [Photobacterium ganghwense]MBV1840403.1 hypothetical protein [Photobacterium ganghwense]PSU11346.1 hypothetical protein C9I92_04400 [Photobacterium ganghwense]QSV13472.1 hypothetical protein FH974_12100 [Photobacterium ganghwense]